MPTGGTGGSSHSAMHLARAQTNELKARLRGSDPHGSMLQAAKAQVASEASRAKIQATTFKVMNRIRGGQVTL